MKTWLSGIAALVALAAGVAVLAQGSASRGEEKAAECAACHGPEGHSEVPEWPKLAGLDEAYIVAQLLAYQKGTRNDIVMAPLADGLTEEDMRDLGAYYASQTMRPTADEPVDRAQLARGERIYRHGLPDLRVAACVVCHGPAGQGDPSAGFTRIGGQHAEYIYLQLEAYRDGRRTDPLGMMGEISARMSDDDMRAVAAYAARLSVAARPVE